VSAIKNKLSAHFGYLMTQAARVKDEVSNSAKVKAIKQKVGSSCRRDLDVADGVRLAGGHQQA
jgi:hypothetical protein